MLDKLLEFSLRQRAAVLLATGLLVVGGVWSAFRLMVDAIPDVTSPQVQINTAVPALAPEEIEQQVTFPLENRLAGLPGMVEFRSLSKIGLSQVTMTFRDDVDIYRTRQLVSERLAGALEELPAGLTPKLSPIATGLGEIYYYTLEFTNLSLTPGFSPVNRHEAHVQAASAAPSGREAVETASVTSSSSLTGLKPGANENLSRREQLMELRQLHETIVKPMLRQTPGLAEVNTTGGYEKQVVIEPDPARLVSAGLTLAELAERIRENTRNVGGGMVEVGGEQIVIRANSRVTAAEQIAALPLKFGGGIKPITVGGVASVGIGVNYRTGAGTVDGQEAVVCAAIMLAGENSRLVSRAVRERLDEIQLKLPPGVEIRSLYDRSHLVNRTLRTVEKNLLEGALLVVVILFFLLGNWRAALIVALAIPLSMLFAMTGMVRLNIPGNLMSLGAIDFGLIIDGAVVMVENILRHLADKQHQLGRPPTVEERARVVLASAKEVAAPMFFGVLIITLVYVPILSLQGIEGKMFKPMAFVVMLALGGSLALALTLMPVLCSLFLGGRIREADNLVMRWLKRFYAPLLTFSLRFRWLVVLPLLVLFAGSLWIFSRLGGELLPELDEGDFTAFAVRSASAGLTVSIEMQCQAERILLEQFPEVTHTFSRIGTDELGQDPMNPNVSDAYIMLKPHDQWRKVKGKPIGKFALIALMRAELLKRIPGQSYVFSQPIQMRFNEILEGTRADVAVKLFGRDFATLEQLAGEAIEVLEKVPGSGDVEPDAVGRAPALEIIPDRSALQRYNLHADDVNSVVETALAGEEVGRFVEGNRRVPVVVRLDESLRANADAIRGLPVGEHSGGLLTLGKVAAITNTIQVSTIVRENAERRVGVLVNVRGRDLAGYVAEAEQKLHEALKLPEGYTLEFGGQFRNLVEAQRRLAVVVPLALVLIFVLVFFALGSLRQVFLVYTGIPLAVTGGIVALWLRGMPFTISAGVGFIALSGVAVLNGLIMISYFNTLREQAHAVHDAVREGALTRLRPVLMTALVASLGFVPMAFSTGAGAEVQRPLATVVIGGIVSSTFLTLVLLPVLYEWLEKRSSKFQVPGTKAIPDIKYQNP